MRRWLAAAAAVIAATGGGLTLFTGSSCACRGIDVALAPVVTDTTSPGSFASGDVLSVSNGSWTSAPVGFAYQWFRCDSNGQNCSFINGATSQTYTMGSGDVGSWFSARVTATNQQGQATSADAAPVGSAGGPTVNWFVAQSAAGAGNGSSCANAAAVSTLSTATHWTAGNVIGLCGTITQSITAQASGSSGSPIEVYWEPNAKISVTSCGGTGCVNIASKSWIILDGGSNGLIEATSEGSGLGTATSIGVYARSGTSHDEIRNLTISDMYVHSSTTDTSGGSNYAVWFDGTNDLFHDNTIHDAMAGFVGEASNSSNQIYNNTISDINWGVFLSGPSANSPNAVTNDQIYSNDISNLAGWDTTTDAFHHDGVIIAGNNNLGTGISHIDIYNNYIHGTSSSPTCSGGNSCATAFIFDNDADTQRVFNNLLVPSSGGSAGDSWIFMWSAGGTGVDTGTELYNNTVVGIGGDVCLWERGDASVKMENNVLSACGTDMEYSTGTTFTTLDFNTYQASSLTSRWQIGASFFSSLSAWRTACSCDASGQATTGSLGFNASFVPQAGSVLLGAATNLTSLGITALNSDKAGVARPSSAAWDAGAYQ